METLRLLCALLVAKLLTLLIKNFTKGGGTAAPGLYALKLDPNIIQHLSQRLTNGTIVVAGTNGKTTTSRMLATMLEKQGVSIIHNREGSNLLRGFASALAAKASFANKPIADYALWEVDEATLPQLLKQVTPNIIILTNLFRDQLDRYGEVAKVRTDWQKVLQTLPKTTTLILNADDPSLAYINEGSETTIVRYSVEAESQTKTISASADANYCPRCHNPLAYTAIYYSHIGKYHCANCGLQHPGAQVLARNLELGNATSNTTIISKQGGFTATINLPGFYNVYNALAAITAAQTLGVEKTTISETLRSFNSAFGRVEEIHINEKTIKLFLVKNPTGFNEVIHTLLRNNMHYEQLVIGINDNFADGTDISWLWDVEFESLAHKIDNITCTGIRAYDMANRLKYAGFDGQTTVEQSYDKIIDTFLQGSSQELVILPTYTVMLELRQYLASKGYIKHYLKEE